MPTPVVRLLHMYAFIEQQSYCEWVSDICDLCFEMTELPMYPVSGPSWNIHAARNKQEDFEQVVAREYHASVGQGALDCLLPVRAKLCVALLPLFGPLVPTLPLWLLLG